VACAFVKYPTLWICDVAFNNDRLQGIPSALLLTANSREGGTYIPYRVRTMATNATLSGTSFSKVPTVRVSLMPYEPG
jgi:hypothetical protein